MIASPSPEGAGSLAAARKFGARREALVRVFGVEAIGCAARMRPPMLSDLASERPSKIGSKASAPIRGEPEGDGVCTTC